MDQMSLVELTLKITKHADTPPLWPTDEEIPIQPRYTVYANSPRPDSDAELDVAVGQGQDALRQFNSLFPDHMSLEFVRVVHDNTHASPIRATEHWHPSFDNNRVEQPLLLLFNIGEGGDMIPFEINEAVNALTHHISLPGDPGTDPDPAPVDPPPASDSGYPGMLIQLSDEENLPLEALAKKRYQARIMMAEAAAILDQTHEEMWKYIHGLYPAAIGWQSTYNKDLKAVILMIPMDDM